MRRRGASRGRPVRWFVLNLVGTLVRRGLRFGAFAGCQGLRGLVFRVASTPLQNLP